MLKKVLTIAAASALSAPAFAGFYFQTEFNGAYLGDDYVGSGTDLHLGYEGGNNTASYYLQGGAFLSNPDGGESSTNFSGKVGGSVAASERVNVFGEFSIVTDSTNVYGTKLGLKIKL